MLSEAVQQIVHAACGDAILLDARRGRALVTDYRRLVTILKNLRNGGFSRLIDFTAVHLGSGKYGCEEFNLLLTLRIPEYNHSALTLKWKWPDLAPHPKPAAVAAAPAPAGPDDDGPQTPAVDPELAALGVSAYAIGPPPAAGNGSAVGKAQEPKPETPPAEEPPQQISAEDIVPHPSLSHIWPAAGLCEREIWEMLGIMFSGNENIRPLLLDEQFPGHPLRRGFEPPATPGYAAGLLKERMEQGMVAALEQCDQRPARSTDIECDVDSGPGGGPDTAPADNGGGAS